mgnify:CR=1 FL=1
MVLVSEELVYRNVLGHDKLEKMLELLESDVETQSYLRMANIMAVSRLMFNDHGVVHSRIVAGSALEMHKILTEYGIEHNVVRDMVGDLEDSMLVTLAGAYLHDIGNSIHREMHNLHGCIIADKILSRLLPKIYPEDRRKRLCIKQEILHCIFSHDESVPALSTEASIVKVADGVDMAEGRARIPYRTGKVDIHSLSALAIKRVHIVKDLSSPRPIRILVEMENEAGMFQVEEVLGRKMMTSGIAKYVQVVALKKGVEIKALAL